MDIPGLLKALENDSNENIIDLSLAEIEKNKKEILGELEISLEERKSFLSLLKDYMFVEDLDKIKIGSYLRWIPVETPTKLTKGGVVCNINITDTGVILLCKNFYNAFFKVKPDDNILFQKLTAQEKTLLHAMHYLKI